jgi:hypothetical protein
LASARRSIRASGSSKTSIATIAFVAVGMISAPV